MAFDLWGTSFTEEENSPFIQPEWPYDFYFGYGIDMIEENALNEKSCIQVLRILIAKADTEIDELEKDLVLLQSELVWAEHEEWHDICCNALRAKINCLDISIRKLRNKDENDIEVYLLMHTEPVEKLHEIMKALLKSFYNEKHEQNEQSQDVVPDSRSGSLEQSAALHKNQKLNSSDSCFIAKEENNGPNVTPKENFTSSNPSMELEVKKANSSETLANADVKDLMPHFLLPAAGQFDEKSIITLLDLETTKKLKESGRALKDKNVVQHFSLKSAQKRKNNLYRTKVKDAAAQCVNDSDLDASKHSAGRLKKKKKTSSSSLKIVSEEATMHTSISAADMLILDSSSNSTGMTGDLTKKVKEEQTADIIANDLGLIAHKQMIGDSSEMKTLGKHDVKINGCEVQGQDTSNFSNSCLNPEHEGNIQNADKVWTRPGQGRPTGLLDWSATNAVVESLKFDMDQKLCDFAVKSARKQRTKESKVASMDKNQHSNSLLKGEEKRNDTLQDVTPKEASPSDNEHSALTSLVEPQDENGEDKTIQLMEEKSQMEEVPLSEVVSSDGKLVTNLYMRLQRGKVKTVKPNMESTAADAEESGLNSMENLSNSSPFPKGKRTWKNTNNCSLNYSLTGKIIKKTVQHSQCEAEGTSFMLDASQNTMPLPQKKCKKLSSVPIVVEFRASSVQMNISKLHGDLNKSNIVKTEFAESGALVDDLGAKGVVPWPLDASSLMKMKLRDLRAIAKSQKLKKYSTMKKEDLVKRLENGLSC
ncbi:SAP-like protein BP-73 [Gossypium arboreum]|uniref:SAP-like protein BP-73 n=1 Tax=Gossypium arboreum TaxID=29729 RepID=A0A0B0MED6_GOSAR|nr:SAP-like protein BP-73 [Gossypium arboreum]